MTIEEIAKSATPVFEAHDVSFAGLFGSRARGDAGTTSDIDFLVKFRTPKGLFEFVGLEQDLERILGCEVDVVTERGLHPALKPEILRDLTPLYGER